MPSVAAENEHNAHPLSKAATDRNRTMDETAAKIDAFLRGRLEQVPARAED